MSISRTRMTRRPRVLFVHGRLGLGGAEVLRMSVLEELLRRGETEPEVVITGRGGELLPRLSQLGVPYRELGLRNGLWSVSKARELAKYFSSRAPAIVQSSQFVTNAHSVLAARKAGVPAVLAEEHGLYRWKKWYHRLVDRHVVSRADAILACSDSVAEFCSRNLGWSPDRISVIHNCAGMEHFEGNSESTEESARIRAREFRGSSFVVVVVGTLRREKGHIHLLEAWRKLINAGHLPSDATLALIGDGPLRDTLARECVDQPGVLLMGSREDTPSLLRAADVFILPSINEGFGIAIVEAMCASLPVISTRVGGIPEVVTENVSGLLVEAGDSDALATAIRGLFSDVGLRKQLGTSGRKIAEDRFSPKAYVDQLMEIYQRLLDR